MGPSEFQSFEDEARSLKGWCLDYLPEEIGGPLPWDYESIARQHLQSSNKVLDLGTGGGEVIDRIRAGWRGQLTVTEEWQVNAPVARDRLGACVVRAGAGALPFGPAAFDLVLSRHEAISPGEVARVLGAGGVFLTQQVVHDYMRELQDYFDGVVIHEDHYNGYQRGLSDAGLMITRAEEHRIKIRFREPGHLIYHLVAAPWMIPGFSISSHQEGIKAILDRYDAGQPPLFTAGYTLLEARYGAHEEC